MSRGALQTAVVVKQAHQIDPARDHKMTRPLFAIILFMHQQENLVLVVETSGTIVSCSV